MNNKAVKQHLQTAKLLMEGIEESMATWDKERVNKGCYSYINTETEHSRESVIRRCVQIRQELLQVMKGLK